MVQLEDENISWLRIRVKQPKKFTDKTQTAERAWNAIGATPTPQYMAGNQLTKKLDTLPK